LLAVVSENCFSGESSSKIAMDLFINENKIQGITPLALNIWEFQVRQSRACIDEVCKQWKLAITDIEKDSVAELFISEKCNIWSIDPSASGILRLYIIGNHQDVLKEIQDFNALRHGLKIRPLDDGLPMDNDSIIARIRNDFHVGQNIDMLQKDIRVAGLLSIGKPGFENLKDIPKYILDIIPNASDRQKLTSISTIEFLESGVHYNYIVLGKDVVNVVKTKK